MQNQYIELLNKAKDLLKEEMTPISFNTWIKTIEIADITNDIIYLKVSSVFQKENLETRYNDLLVNTFSHITNQQRQVCVVLEDINNDIKEPEVVNNNQSIQTSNLKPEYTFDTFVIGDNNRFAQAAALAVTEAPGTIYNPLFLFGGPGLGKTHLLHAIGNEMLRKNPNAKILYVPSEKFINDFINAIKDVKTEQFRNKYRNIDILLIDDIQFIAGKDKNQEEFFHTFNSLYDSGKQIVLTSDEPPKNIKLLDERLISRLEWGLLVDISVPNFETRLAILRKKADREHIIVDDEILSMIATKIDTNIRELEGVLTKVLAISSLTGGQITPEMTQKAINTVISEKEKVVSSDYIQEVIANYFDIDKRDLKTSKRSQDIAYPRQIAMYLCRSIAGLPFAQIGQDFGKRDHTTVMHAYKKIESDLKDNLNTKLIVDSVKNIILNSK